MRINVTAEDIANGARGDCYACPIALAARRAGLEDPDVQDFLMYVSNDLGDVESTDLPAEAGVFMDRFDDGLPVQPFSFEVEI